MQIWDWLAEKDVVTGMLTLAHKIRYAEAHALIIMNIKKMISYTLRRIYQ